MSISQANIEWISTLSGVSKEDISGALSNEEEVTLDLKLSGRVVSQDEEKTLKENAVQQGKELGYKDIAKGLGIKLDAGDKDPLVISEKLKTSITESLEEKYKGQTPSDELKREQDKVVEWEGKYNKLTETYEEEQKKVVEWETKYTEKEKEIKTKNLNSSISKLFPEKMKMDKNDAILIFTNTFEFDESDGKQIIKRNGETIMDSVGNPEKLENIVPSFVEEKQWVKGRGMGGGDRGGSGGEKGGKTPDEAYRILTEKGIAPASPEGIKMFQEMTKTA